MSDNIINSKLEVKNTLEAFKTWLLVTEPLHKLSKIEQSFLALLLYKRYELSNKVNDEEILFELILSNSNKKLYKEILGFKENTRIPNLISSLRKKKVLIGNKINPAYIPNVTNGFNSFVVRFLVKINDNGL